ncbi:MAG: LysE family translocator [Candidatus Aminicenantaceae bacterium]
MFIILGLLIGFFAAIPIGPVNIFAVSQTVKHDFLHGFSIGLTSSLLDATYCFVAIQGISKIAVILAKSAPVLKLTGAVLLTAIGIGLIKHSNTLNETQLSRKIAPSRSRPIIVTFFLYTSNPSLYAFWLAIAGIVTTQQWVSPGILQPAAFALSCGCGSALWYCILTKYVSKYHHLFKPKTFRKILIGLAVVLFGLAAYNSITILI